MCHQIIEDNYAWAEEVAGNRHPFPCLHEDVLELVGPFNPRLPFNEKKKIIFRGPLNCTPSCLTHGVHCPGLVNVDFNVSGLPCTDNSRAKHGREFEEGPTGPIFISWALYLKRFSIRMAILENTPAA